MCTDSRPLNLLITVATCGLLIISSILLAVSFDTLEPQQVGIAYNKNTQHIDSDKLYGSGRYLIGLGQEFIKFPVTYQSVALGNFDDRAGTSVTCRSNEGMEITVDVTFQYQLSLQVQDLVRLHLDLGTNYYDVYVSLAYRSVRDACSRYGVYDYFSKRTEIANDMSNTTNTALKRLYANVVTFELVNMEFQPEFADVIEKTQVAIQDIQQAQAEKEIAQVKASSSVVVATTLADVTRRRAVTEATSFLATVRADADALLLRTDRQIDAFQTLKANLTLNSEELLGYIWLNALEETGASKLSILYETPDELSFS